MRDQGRFIPWHRSLRFRLVAAAVTIELIMLTALLANSFHLLDKAVESQTQARLEALSPLLDAALAGRVFHRDHTEVAAILNRLTTSKRADIRYLAVLDPAGELIAASGDMDPAALPAEDHSVSDALKDLTYDTRLPLTIMGNEVGTVHFGLSLSSMVATQNRVVREGVVIASIEILLSLVLLATGGYLITRHIRALAVGTRRVAQGDYSTKILIPGQDEIAMLAHDFNSMSSAVAAHVDELRTSEMRFAAIFNSVGEAIIVHDAATGQIVDVNQRMCEMYGYTRPEALEADMGMLSADIGVYTMQDAAAKIKAAVSGMPQVFDWVARAKDGRLFWAEVSMRKVRIGDEERLIAVVRDITERKKAEEEKNMAITRFRTLVDSLDALVYVADMKTYEIIFVNKYGQEVWGDVTGKTCWQTLQAGQAGPCSFCTNEKLLDSDGKPTGTQVTLMQNTVTKEWYECRDQAIPWTDGRLVRMEVALNITRRKAAEDALAAETERLAVTLRSIGDGVITTDTEGRIVLMNAVAEKMTGWSQNEAQGRPLTEVLNIINEETRTPCENPVERVMTTGQITGLANHIILISRDGRERKIADSGAPIRDRESRIIGVVLVFRDVTEKLRMEEELLKVRKLESVGILAGGIAHDFNNILAAILGNISLALTDAKLEDKTRKRLSEAEKASIRARDLTRQLLTFSKGGAPVKEAASISEIIKDSAEFVLHGGNVACSYSIPDDLWIVDIDKSQISQVIQNIIINAKQAMPRGGTIRVNCENVERRSRAARSLPSKGRFIRIDIADSGPGIPDGIIDRIFDPYFTTKQEGSGLGLAIAHSIVSKHNGSIAVQSKAGEGTTFTIYLPVSEREQEPQEEVKTTAPSAGRAKIMVMDDEQMIRDVAKAMLEMLGHEVVLAASGEDAIELFRKCRESGAPIDMCIMDLTVPGSMGGKRAVQEILAMDPNAKVVVSSGYSNDPIMARCHEYGFCAAIVKPFDIDAVTRIVNQFLPPVQ